MKTTFEELPQNVKDYITKICGDDGFEMLRCGKTNCILISGGVVGAVSYFFSSPSVVWMNGQDIKLMHNALIGPTGKKDNE